MASHAIENARPSRASEFLHRAGIQARKFRKKSEQFSVRAAERIRPNLLTVSGLGCIDVGAFCGNTIAGWVVTGLSLLLLDYKNDGE